MAAWKRQRPAARMSPAIVGAEGSQEKNLHLREHINSSTERPEREAVSLGNRGGTKERDAPETIGAGSFPL